MSFPKELKNKKQWVCWRFKPDPNGGKPKKVPINPVTGKGAMSNNPDTWTDYETALTAAENFGYTGMQSPFVSISQAYMKQANVIWADISQIVKENCSVEVKFNNPEDDMMENLLRRRNN